LDHSKVEPYYGCRSATRLGPYPTPEEAAHALELAAERNDTWDTDPRFNDPPEEDDADENNDKGWGLFG
jgi:hypothetical protein